MSYDCGGPCCDGSVPRGFTLGGRPIYQREWDRMHREAQRPKEASDAGN